MRRSPSNISDESGLKKGPWTPEEDELLIRYIQKHGHGSWRALPRLAGLNRCGKSCRLRWTNYLRPDIKRGKFSLEEEQTILNLHAILGNKWSAIATHLPGRTDNEIKNFWNTHLKKKLIQMGFDPMTHRPRTDIFSSLPHLIALAKLIENPVSWELEQAVRLQNEATQLARLTLLQNLMQPHIPILSPNNFQNTHNTNSNNDSNAAQEVVSNFDVWKDASILGHLEQPPQPLPIAGDVFPATKSFSHLPNLLQVPVSSEVSDQSIGGCDFGGGVLSSPWMREIEPPSAAPPVAEFSLCETTVEGNGAPSYGVSQMWSDLLADPIFHEIGL